MIKRLEEIARSIGLTKTELSISLFITAVFVVGIAGKYYIFAEDEIKLEKFDYSKHDSLFNAANHTLDSSKIIEKRVDSEQELLDFSVNKFSLETEENQELTEKSININTAGIDQLVLLPGIGKKTAEKIINYRETRSGFKNLLELKEVKGIGDAKYAKIARYVYIE